MRAGPDHRRAPAISARTGRDAGRAQAAVGRIVAVDVREILRSAAGGRVCHADVRSAELASCSAQAPDVVVHLAAIVTPGKDSNREFEYAVDVSAPQNVLKACLAAGVGKSSSPPAARPTATTPTTRPGSPRTAGARQREFRLRVPQAAGGGDAGALARSSIRSSSRSCSASAPSSARPAQPDHRPVRKAAPDRHPRLGQPLRVHLGPGRGRRDPARDRNRQDRHLQSGRRRRARPQEIAARLGKPCVALPAWLMGRAGRAQEARPHAVRPGAGGLPALPAGARQSRLKQEFGYVPRKTSREVFDFWRQAGMPG